MALLLVREAVSAAVYMIELTMERARSRLTSHRTKRREVSDMLGLAPAESDYEQFKTGNGDCKHKTAGHGRAVA